MQQCVTPSDNTPHLLLPLSHLSSDEISSQIWFHVNVSELTASTYELFSFLPLLDIRRVYVGWKKKTFFIPQINCSERRREIFLRLGVAPNFMTWWNFVNPYLASFIYMRLRCNRHLYSLFALVINTFQWMEKICKNLLKFCNLRWRERNFVSGGRSWSWLEVPESLKMIEEIEGSECFDNGISRKTSTRLERNLSLFTARSLLSKKMLVDDWGKIQLQAFNKKPDLKLVELQLLKLLFDYLTKTLRKSCKFESFSVSISLTLI